MPATPGVVVAISSHVARGCVGNRAVVFALERLGFTVWAVPTVLLPYHPGHGPGPRMVAEGSDFEAMLQALIQGRASEVAGVISGYLASPAQALAVAALVRAVKAANPEALYLCDPVMGDAGRLYVAEALGSAIRDLLVPLADALTPNAFEYAFLAGERGADYNRSAELAGRLGAPVILVTSAPALMRGQIGNLLLEGDRRTAMEHPAVTSTAKGTGDLLAALLLARRLQGLDWPCAAELAVASVYEVLAGTAKGGSEELLLPALQQVLVQPRAGLSIRQIGGRPASGSPIEL